MRQNINSAARELMLSLGSLVNDFSQLEYSLRVSTALLINPKDPHVGSIVTAGKAYSSLVDLFDALCRHATKEENKFVPLVKRLISANEQRNKIIHSRYLLDAETKTFFRSKSSIKGNRGFKRDKENTNPEHIYEVCKLIRIIENDLYDFTASELASMFLMPVAGQEIDSFRMAYINWWIEFSSFDTGE